jgi:hypothetical protein
MSSFDPQQAVRDVGVIILQPFKRNYGPFLVALVCVALATGAGIAAVMTELNESRSADTALNKLLDTKILPSRRVDRLAVAGAALNLIEERLRHRDPDLLGGKLERFEEQIEGKLHESMGQIEGKLHESMGQIEGKLRESTPTTRDPPEDIKLTLCSANHKSLTVVGDPFVFVPVQLAFPQTVLPSVADTWFPAVEPLNWLAEEEAKRAHAWTPKLKSLAEGIKNPDYTLVQAYYITRAGVTTNWSPSNVSTCELYADDDGFSLAERPYMIMFRDRLQTGEANYTYKMKLYVDAGGMGIVGTTCVAEANTLTGQLLGAACADYRPTKVMELLGDPWTSGLLQATITDKKQTPASLNVRTSILCDDEAVQHACRIPLAPLEGKWLEMTYQPPNWRPLMAFGAFSLLAAGAVVYFVRITSTWRTAEARVGLLRDLPAGILRVEVKLDGLILAASDRAEELLKTPLPSFVVEGDPSIASAEHGTAAQRAARRVLFWNLFEDAGFSIDEHGKAEWRENLAASMLALRLQGLSSTYWVCLKGKDPSAHDSWLEVVGTPEFLATQQSPKSFTLIVKPDQARLSQSLATAPWKGVIQ